MKDIKGYEGEYAVTSCGKVWSYKSKKFLAIGKDGNGYSQVELNKNGKRKVYKLHRLVAETYLPNPDNLSDVAHLDESRDNCHVNNLCWMTHKDNCNMPKFKERLSKLVYCEELDKIFESQSIAAEELGLYQSNISCCCNGKIKSTGGYHFRFATEEEIAIYKLKTSLDKLTDAIEKDLHLERIGIECNALLESAC